MAQRKVNMDVPYGVTSPQASTGTDNGVVPASTQAYTAATPTEISDVECHTQPVGYC